MLFMIFRGVFANEGNLCMVMKGANGLDFRLYLAKQYEMWIQQFINLVYYVQCVIRTDIND